MTSVASQTRLARWWDGDLAYGFRRSPVAIVSALVLAVCLAAALFAPWIAPHNPFDLATLNLTDALAPPHGMAGARPEYLLGTDDQGRDMLSAIMFWTRISLLVGVAAVALSVMLGVSLGLVSGYGGGRLDAFIMHAADVQLSFPAILIALLIDGSRASAARRARRCRARGAHHRNWRFQLADSACARCGAHLVEKGKEYVQAARSASRLPPSSRHLLPNVLGPVRAGHDQHRHCHCARSDAVAFGGVPPTRPRAGTLIRVGNDFLFSGNGHHHIPGAALVIGAGDQSARRPAARRAQPEAVDDAPGGWRRVDRVALRRGAGCSSVTVGALLAVEGLRVEF
jgi:peptide/nickel transport system permease protein